MFATRDLSKKSRGGWIADRGEKVMDHRRLIPQARRIKQIVLWTDLIRLTNGPVRTKRLAGMAQQDKGGSMAS
jgi:hypothetical protein